MGRAAAQIARQSRRHLVDPHAKERGLDDHLADKLHARTAEAQPVEGFVRQGAQAAIHIADLRTEQKIDQRGQ
jgi:hypothetical protein